MNKKRFLIIISIILVIVGVVGSIHYYLYTQDSNTLTIVEKRWIESNKKKIIDFSIVNDIPIISSSGEGVFFDFLNDLENATKLSFNKISYNIGANPKSEYALVLKENVDKNDILLYKDNYVLVSKEDIIFDNINEISGTIGVLNNEMDKLNGYLIGTDVSFKSYETVNKMVDALKNEEVKYISIPKTTYLEKILENGFNIVYNISDYETNYVITLGSTDKLNNIINKYYKKWKSEKYDDSYSKYFSDAYFKYSKIDDKDIVDFKSKRYVYGFTFNAPYDTLVYGKLSGFNKSLLESFSKVTGVEISYKKVYDSIEKLLSDFNSNEIDFMFNNTSNKEYKMDIYNTKKTYPNEYVIVTNLNSELIVNSINSLKSVEVSVLKNSTLEAYLTENNVKVKSYDNIKKLLDSANKNSVIAIDKWTYDYAIRKELDSFKVVYNSKLNSDYNFIVRNIKDNSVFAKYLSFYISFVDSKEIINNGYKEVLYVDYKQVIYHRLLISVIIIVVIAVLVLLLNVLNPKNRNNHNKSLTKEEKLKYIDMITSLKNRNYFNDNLEKWDESEIYPQTIIIVDLNNIAYINDNYGHAEGDKVIKEAANILIKSQLPNTDIIRTNGNEFLIYMVEYDEKQVISYIRKLNKDFKDLAHGFGAAIGYSMIQDAIKTVDDAVNEATIDMRNNKEANSNNN